MKKKIKVYSPSFDTNDRKSLTAKVKLKSSTGEAALAIDFKPLSQFIGLSSPLLIDFFIISASVYGIDRSVERRSNSVDGWSREFQIEFPVSDISLWNPLKKDLDGLLSFLTGDYWDVSFYHSPFTFVSKKLKPKFNGLFNQVNLFSGGLDSLIGAIDFLETNPNERLLLTSHHDNQMGGPRLDQKCLIKELDQSYPNRFIHVPTVRVSLDESDEKMETTFRSRSILFIGIALVVGSAKQINKIAMPENGSVSLNYPLSPSRRGSCSTRTTHPRVISNINSILQKLNIDINIFNPYEFQTKGEMVTNCKSTSLLSKIASSSNSCGKRGHRFHWGTQGTHCGVCMPCIYRRASLLSLNDTTVYGNDINSLPPFTTKKGQDIGACLEFLGRPISPNEIKQELIISGLIGLPNLDSYCNLVQRTRVELSQLFSKIGNDKIKQKANLP